MEGHSIGKTGPMSEFVQRLSRTRAQLTERVAQCDNTSREINKCKKQLLEVYAEIEKVDRQEDEAMQELLLTKSAAEDEDARLKELMFAISDLRKDKKEMLRENGMLADEYEKRRYEFKELFDQHCQSENTARSISKKIRDISAELEGYNKQYSASVDRAVKYTKEHARLEQELDQLHAAMAALTT